APRRATRDPVRESCNRPDHLFRPEGRYLGAVSLSWGAIDADESANVPIATANLSASIDLERCVWEPASSARRRSSSPARAVSAAAGVCPQRFSLRSFLMKE